MTVERLVLLHLPVAMVVPPHSSGLRLPVVVAVVPSVASLLDDLVALVVVVHSVLALRALRHLLAKEMTVELVALMAPSDLVLAAVVHLLLVVLPASVLLLEMVEMVCPPASLAHQSLMPQAVAVVAERLEHPVLAAHLVSVETVLPVQTSQLLATQIPDLVAVVVETSRLSKVLLEAPAS